MIFEGTKKLNFFGLGLTRAGKPVPFGVLDGITRESVESTLANSGSGFVKKSIDVSI